MPIETEKENICINENIGQRKIQFEIEGDLIVNDIKPDILKVINASGIPFVYKKEVMNGKVRLDGSVSTYIIYLADSTESSIRSLNTSIDFTKIIDIEEITEEMLVNEEVNVKSIKCEILNERKINIKVILEVDLQIYLKKDIALVTGVKNISDIQILDNNKNISAILGTGISNVYAKENIQINSNDDLAEIMSVNIKIIDKESKLSYNKVLAKANANVTVLYLTEDNRINSVNTNVGIMGFIDMENINDNSICDIKYKIKNIIIKPNSGENSSIYIEIQVEINCTAYESRTISLIEDMYSINSELSVLQKNIRAISEIENLSNTYNLNEEISIIELENNKILNLEIEPKIVNATIKDGKIIYEVESNIEILYEINDGIEVKNIQVPFNFEMLSENINSNSSINTNIEVKNQKATIDNGKIKISADLEFNMCLYKNQDINAINEIKLEENKQEDLYSMVIYFVKKGDTLWKIAKNFKSTVDDIVRVNNIENENKINIGEQLYIPKFVGTNVVV